MELNITRFAKTAELGDISGSIAELGKDAAQYTWANAKREAESNQLIDEESRDEFESWAKDFGAWEEEEIAAWSLDECNALLLQYIAGDLREIESLCYSDDDEFSIDWTEYEKLAERGTIGGNIYKRDDGQLYFYMGD
jgi:hypothetical protein